MDYNVELKKKLEIFLYVSMELLSSCIVNWKKIFKSKSYESVDRMLPFVQQKRGIYMI